MMKTLILLAGMLLGMATTGCYAGTLQAGAAKVDITPAQDAFPFYGHVNYTGVHDPLYARAVVLSDGTKKVAFVVLDEGFVPEPQQTLAMVSKASEIPESNIILAATHTHSTLLSNYFGEASPILKKQITHIQQGAVTALQQAMNTMQDATVAFGRTKAYVNTNNGEMAQSKDGYDPDGVSDKTLDVVKISDRHNKNIALLVNYASHAEVMFKSITKDGGAEITGDLPGVTANYLEQAPSGAPVVLYTAGSEGDQLPLFKSVQRSPLLGNVDEGIGGWTLLDVQARRLATSVLSLLPTLNTLKNEEILNGAAGSVALPGQRAKRNHETGKVTITKSRDVNVPIVTLKIGDLNFVAVGADIASSIGIHIREQMPDPDHTVLITMLAGHVGYILDDKAYDHPGHGVVGSKVQPGYAKQLLSENIYNLLEKM